jgi:hypothetical protein
MIKHTYSKKVKNLDIEKLWKMWTNVNSWNTWQDDIEFAAMEGDFIEQNYFILKPKGGPRVKIQLLKVQPLKQFIDLTVFPLAKMYGDHEFIVHENNEIEIKTTMSIEGPLAFLWNKLVMQGIVQKLDQQTESLITTSMHG